LYAYTIHKNTVYVYISNRIYFLKTFQELGIGSVLQRLGERATAGAGQKTGPTNLSEQYTMNCSVLKHFAYGNKITDLFMKDLFYQTQGSFLSNLCNEKTSINCSPAYSFVLYTKLFN
jgi:hypothetical protein